MQCFDPALHAVSPPLLLLLHSHRSCNALTPHQFVIVRTKLESAQGRKAKVSGTMETLDGEKIADAR
jgi:hypothetical protein